MYIMLEVLQSVVEQFDDWRHDNSESETTVYRRFVVLLDKLLRNTSIMLQDGENASNATKDAMILLQSLTSSITTTNERTEMSMYGRKIDLLAITESREQNMTSSSEWKREGASESISLKQQCKTMDWLGTSGYGYSLKFVEKPFVAQTISCLVIPKQASELGGFEQTLDFMFKWRNFLLATAKQVGEQMMRNNESVRGIVDLPPRRSRYTELPPNIIITPGKRRSFDQVDE
ncbi:hypothetical protein BX666DRAFT_1530730 [Dichotomocladium elegans]|nr:hypothetical protein BX666DRAFT_1530730 [Dichotomocladium elegans]